MLQDAISGFHFFCFGEPNSNTGGLRAPSSSEVRVQNQAAAAAAESEETPELVEGTKFQLINQLWFSTLRGPTDIDNQLMDGG